MTSLGIRPSPALAGLLLRASLALVLLGWAYDIFFNPVYYAHVLRGTGVPIMLLLLGIGASFVLGVGIRLAAGLAAVMFALFGLALEGRQPLGLPQNAGLAAGALALALLGPGALALRGADRPVAARSLSLAGTIIRAGLALTFLVYGVQKLVYGDEYRIIVAGTPVVSLLAKLAGAQATVYLVGASELLLAFAILSGARTVWAASLLAAALAFFLATRGYPSSYPQDVGLLGVLAALVCAHRTGCGARGWAAGRPVC